MLRRASPRRSTVWISARPVRPLPSMNGWMVSNCAWAIAARTTGLPSVAVRKRARSSTSRSTSPGGGGTKSARSGLHPGPPTQFCSVRRPLGRCGCDHMLQVHDVGGRERVGRIAHRRDRVLGGPDVRDHLQRHGRAARAAVRRSRAASGLPGCPRSTKRRCSPSGSADGSDTSRATDPLIRAGQHRQGILCGLPCLRPDLREALPQLVGHVRQVPARARGPAGSARTRGPGSTATPRTEPCDPLQPHSDKG